MKRQGELWIFDMDGTLFQSESVAVPAFRQTFTKMREAGVQIPNDVTDQAITGTFGYTHDHIWRTLIGESLEPQLQEKSDRWLIEAEIDLLQNGSGGLFPGVIETLKTLHEEGATLAVASNGQQSYIESIVQTFGIADWFAGLYSASGYRMRTKVDLVKLLLEEIDHERAVMIGDRSSDIEAGLHNGLPAIGCAFGFADRHELQGATMTVRHFSEILQFHF